MGEHAARYAHPWRWMILLARSFLCFIVLGFYKSLGVFLPHFVESFSTNTAVAGIVNSATLAIGGLITGPFVGALMKVWSSRQLSAVGGMVAAACVTMASFSSSMKQLAVWFTLSSVGLSFVLVSSVQPLMEYFPEHFAFANGVSFAGGTIGMMVLPPVMEWLVSLYGWRDALRLMGALSFNYVVGAALFRPLNEMTHYSLLPIRIDAMKTSSRSRSQTGGEFSDKKADSGKKMTICRAIFEIVGDLFDAGLLTDPPFLTHLVVFVLTGMTFSMWHLFLIPQGVQLDFGDTPSAFLGTFGGAGSLIGRLGHGPLVDLDLLKASTLFVLASLILALVNLLNPLAVSSYTAIAAIATVSGIGIGVTYPLSFVLMREITGDRKTSAYSWLFLTHGAGGLLGGAFAGFLHDVTGEYKFVFMAVGAAAVTSAAILVVMRCVLHFCKTTD